MELPCDELSRTLPFARFGVELVAFDKLKAQVAGEREPASAPSTAAALGSQTTPDLEHTVASDGIVEQRPMSTKEPPEIESRAKMRRHESSPLRRKSISEGETFTIDAREGAIDGPLR